jgi:hypothetical protein
MVAIFKKKNTIGKINPLKVSKKISMTARREMNSFPKKEKDTKDIGKIMLDTVLELRFGQMDPSMKDTGKITILMEKVSFGISMVTSTKVPGSVIKLMVSASTLTTMVVLMRGSGVIVFSTERVLSS